MFRRKEAKAATKSPPTSPRAMIRPPASMDAADPSTSGSARALIRPPPSMDGGDTTSSDGRERVNTPTSPLHSRPNTSEPGPEDSPSKPVQVTGKKLVIKPSTMTLSDEDTTATQQEYSLGKGMIRPALSPVEPHKKDFFSRFSIRKAAPVNPPAPSGDNAALKANGDDIGAAADDAPLAKPGKAIGLENSSESDVVTRIAQRRGWGKTFPTNNPHVMHVLLKEAQPFKKIRKIQAASATELGAALEATIYATPKNIGTASKHRFRRGDVIVCGSIRSGQTPILQIVASLKAKQYVPAQSVVDLVQWVEGPFKPGRVESGRSIYKTHMPCPQALKGDRGKMVEHKVICVVRDPADVRLSWGRHVRRLVKKCCQHSIEQNLGIAAFADCIMPSPLLPKQQEIEVEGREPEHAIAWAILAAQEFPECFLLIFYEELLSDPCKVVEKIARFTAGMQEEEVEKKRTAASSGGGDEEVVKEDPRKAEARRIAEAELIVSITNELIKDPSHPNAGKRNGSSGQGAVCFGRDALEKFDENWEQVVAISRAGKYASYAHLYQSLTEERYLFADKGPNSSGGFFGRVSNLSHGSETKARTGSNLGSNGTSSSSSKLKKKESSSETDPSGGGVVKPRKFGGSFMSFISPNHKATAAVKKDSNANSGIPLAERPAVTRTPAVFSCIDPDDSDDEAVKGLGEWLKA